MTTDNETIDARSESEKLREAIGLIVGCVIALGVPNCMGDQFNKDLWRAYQLAGGSKSDLLRLLSK